jgi:D-arabinose 1-dehydrogenase-like Zn-dependent alcohol dehydrogenase
VGVGNAVEITDEAKPTLDPGPVPIMSGGAGVYHADVPVLEAGLGFRGDGTLGHETVGGSTVLIPKGAEPFGPDAKLS